MNLSILSSKSILCGSVCQILCFSGTLGAAQRAAPALGPDASLCPRWNRGATVPARHPPRPSKSQALPAAKAFVKIDIHSKTAGGIYERASKGILSTKGLISLFLRLDFKI
jgi:hypothetical protein